MCFAGNTGNTCLILMFKKIIGLRPKLGNTYYHINISRDLLHCWRCSYSKEVNTQKKKYKYKKTPCRNSRSNLDITNTQMHYRSLFWLTTDTSIKCGGLKWFCGTPLLLAKWYGNASVFHGWVKCDHLDITGRIRCVE